MPRCLISLPYIEGGIGTGGVYGTWVSTAYLIGEIIVIPLTDFLSRVFSLRRYLLANTALFLFFSVLYHLRFREGPRVRRLAGGGRRIRTLGPSPGGSVSGGTESAGEANKASSKASSVRRRDRGFESVSLHRRVCEPSVPPRQVLDG
jgi:hypothetical protein